MHIPLEPTLGCTSRYRGPRSPKVAGLDPPRLGRFCRPPPDTRGGRRSGSAATRSAPYNLLNAPVRGRHARQTGQSRDLRAGVDRGPHQARRNHRRGRHRRGQGPAAGQATHRSHAPGHRHGRDAAGRGRRHRQSREAAAKAQAIEDAVYDLKAVNPHKTAEVDTRTPVELLDLIESKGREVAEARAALRAMV